MTIREASSIIVHRQGQVFLVRRTARLRFFGGFWAFPGGTVRPVDVADDRFVEAAVRELFEELGLELWSPSLGTDRDPIRRHLLEADAGRDAPSRARAVALWGELESRVTFEGDRLLPVVRLLTPSYHPVRYDTVFYRLDLDPGAASGAGAAAAEPEVWPGELEEGRWDTPAGWLASWRRGELQIAPPVVVILHTLEAGRKESRPGSLRPTPRRRRTHTLGWDALDSLSAAPGEERMHTIFHNPAAQLFPLVAETLPPATHTNAYLVGNDPAYVIDPGTADPEEQDRFVDALHRALAAGPVPERKLGGILLTHHHRDHIGAALRIREEFGVPILAQLSTWLRLRGVLDLDDSTARARWAVQTAEERARLPESVPSIPRNRVLRDGTRLPLGTSPDGRPGWELEVFYTPGHAPGHLCFFERRYGSLFVGDMVSALSSVLVRRKDGTMADYLASLRRLASLPSEMIYPAHGPAVTGGPAILEQQLRHRAEREAQILAAIGAGSQAPGGADPRSAGAGAGASGAGASVPGAPGGVDLGSATSGGPSGGASASGGVTAEEIVRRVYVDVPPAVLPHAAESVASVAEKLVGEGRIVRVGDGWCLAIPATMPASGRRTKGPHMKPKQRVAALREQMERHGLDAYLIPSSDPHQSEYVPECWQRRTWISGFTGSAGEVVVLRKHGGLWTDGRYFLQAEDELRGSGIHLYKSGQAGVPTIEELLGKQLAEGARVGVDPSTVSVDRAASLTRKLGEFGITLVFPEENLVDTARGEANVLPVGEVQALAVKYTGESIVSKLRRLRKEMKEQRADVHVLSALDSIAWLFNIRGRDIAYNPVTIAYALVTGDEAVLFIDDAKINESVRKTLSPQVTFRPYEDFDGALRELGAAKRRVWVDRKSATRRMMDLLEGASTVERTSPVVLMKSVKNGVEAEGMRQAHIRDGVAMVRFLRWFEEAVPDGGMTEIIAADQLEKFRSEGQLFQGLAFRTISGYAGHGAIIHYTVTPRTDVEIKPEGIYLLDSGGQYLDGTTDITRTILLGRRATKEQRDRFTRVLKGHIAISTARFPQGTLAPALDTLARKALWDVGLDYNHGTGHGVGCFLNVHEGPRSIANRPDGGYPIEPGNVFSNEPGYYKPGEYGLRIENLILAFDDGPSEEGGRHYLRFEDLTVCPIDTRLIDPNLLDKEERKWLDAYHRRVKKMLTPFLEKEDKEWLADACAPI